MSRRPGACARRVAPLAAVVAPDSFKGAATALEVANALAAGLRRAGAPVEPVVCPMADGGEGTVQALVDATGGRVVSETVTGPLGDPVRASYGILGDGLTAVIETAAASGLPLLPPSRRDPRFTTSYGTGQLVSSALNRGMRRFIVGLGGSATNDGGAGFAAALGVRFLDAEGRPLPPGGLALGRLARIDASGVDPRLAEATFIVAADVDAPLTGPHGASAVFGPQKGATPEMIAELDRALQRFGALVERDVGVSVAHRPGAGAAGGLGAALLAFCRAELRSGIEIVIEAAGLRKKLVGADLVLSGEGQIDRQTLGGKTPLGVLRAAREVCGPGVPVVLFAGSLGPGAELLLEHGATAVVPIAPGPISLAESVRRTPELLAAAAERALRLMLARPGAGGARLNRR